MYLADYSSGDRELIRFLYEAENWADLYDLHRQFTLSPGQVLDILERLLALGFVEHLEGQARLTSLGREWVLAARSDIFMAVEKGEWRAANDVFLEPPLDPITPYLPDLSLVDSSFFARLALAKSADDDRM